MDIQVVGLIECNLICPQDMNSTFDSSQCAGKNVTFCDVVIGSGSQNGGSGEGREFLEFSDHWNRCMVLLIIINILSNLLQFISDNDLIINTHFFIGQMISNKINGESLWKFLLWLN